MNNDFFKITPDDEPVTDGNSASVSDMGEDSDFKIGKPTTEPTPTVAEPIIDSSSDLDDTRLSDDFVIGQDFFIDSADADNIAEESAQSEVNKKRKKRKK